MEKSSVSQNIVWKAYKMNDETSIGLKHHNSRKCLRPMSWEMSSRFLSFLHIYIHVCLVQLQFTSPPWALWEMCKSAAARSYKAHKAIYHLISHLSQRMICCLWKLEQETLFNNFSRAYLSKRHS